MRECLVCGAHCEMRSCACVECGTEVEILDGVARYSKAVNHDGFDNTHFDQLVTSEAGNFWFESRNNLIASLIRKHASTKLKYLEIGCGTGFVLKRVAAELSNAEIFGSEYFDEGLIYARKRVPRAEFIQMDGRKIPFSDEFDLIGLYDVIEHIDNDLLVLQQINKALTQSGMLILTVPQHQWLWSHADEYAHHQRRYSSTELARKLEEAGFEVKISSSFVVSLFPLLALSRILSKRRNKESYDPKSESAIPNWANRLMFKFLSIEVWLITKGVRFPFGGSRIVLAVKTNSEGDVK